MLSSAPSSSTLQLVGSAGMIGNHRHTAAMTGCLKRRETCSTSLPLNLDGLGRTEQPLLVMRASHEGGSRAASFSTNQAGGLPKNLPICKDARVILTANLWPDAGLVNGAQGTVGYIVFSEGAAPPRINLPAILICRFPTYKGPSFLPEISDRLVPVYPVQRDWNPGIDKSQKSKFESRKRNLKF